MSYTVQRHKTPVGSLYLVGRGDDLCGIIYEKMWPVFEPRFSPLAEKDSKILQRTKMQLDEYFAGKRSVFDLQITMAVGTDFQKKVWNALRRIPYGETKTYKEQAVYLNAPQASRAVGRADGLNPISIVVPCHRVIGSNGALTGYAGGLKAKQFLLKLEAERA